VLGLQRWLHRKGRCRLSGAGRFYSRCSACHLRSKKKAACAHSAELRGGFVRFDRLHDQRPGAQVFLWPVHSPQNAYIKVIHGRMGGNAGLALCFHSAIQYRRASISKRPFNPLRVGH